MQAEQPRSLSILIPAFNEVRNLEAAVKDVLAAASGFGEYEVLIVDDGSTDGTGRLADDLAATYSPVRAIHHPGNRGFGAAYGTALAEAQMAYFTFVPGDHEVASESVRAIFDATGKADIVVPYHATPWLRGFFRRALTWISTTQVNLLFGWRLKYYQGPAVYPTELARQLPRTVRGFFFATEMLVHALAAGYTWIEVGLTHQERGYGRSKAVTLANIRSAQWTILRLWFQIRVLRQRRVPLAGRPEASPKVLEGAQL